MKIVKVQKRKSDVVVGIPKKYQHLIKDSKYVKVEIIDDKICYSRIIGD